jgi:hypothetical protein
VANADLKEVRETYVTLRELVMQNPGGWDDAASRLKAERLCNAGMQALDDAECRERLRTVLTQARELFSHEDHLKWSRAKMSGADYLRLQILIGLEAVNTRLFFIDAIRGRSSVQQPAQDFPPAFEH